MDLKKLGRALLAAVPTIAVLGGFEPYLNALASSDPAPAAGSAESHRDAIRARERASSHVSEIQDSLRMALNEMSLIQRTIVGSLNLQSQMDLILDGQRKIDDAVGNARQHDVALQQVISGHPGIRREAEPSRLHPELEVAQDLSENLRDKVRRPNYLGNRTEYLREFDTLHGVLASALRSAQEFGQSFQPKVGQSKVG